MSTIATLTANETGANSLIDINNNFSNLNADKLEASSIASLTDKTTPVNADSFPITDSEASNVLKKLSFTNLKAFLKTYFDTLYPSGSGSSTGTNTGDETETTLLSKLTVFADSKNDTGFYDNTNISVAYDKTTRTITLTRTGGVIYYFQGKKYTLTSPWTSSAHTNSAGTYFLYSTDGVTFSWSTTPWTFDAVMVALVIYDGADGWSIREVHGLMDIEAHKNAHNNIGTWRSSGGLLTAGTYTENTASDAANSPGFDQAVVNDEDIATTIPAWTEGTYTTMYIGASSTATFSTVATLPFVSAGSYLQVNNPSTGSMTNGVNNRYYNVYQILVPAGSDTDSQKRRMIMLQPQATYTSLTSAQAEDPRSLSLGDFATKATEFTVYARITYITSVGDANTGKCRIATGGVSYVIGNRLSSSSVTGSPTNHAGLTNLSWTSSGHTGTLSTLAGFDSSNVPAVYSLSGTGTVIPTTTSPSFTTPSLGVATATTINGATITSGTLNGSVTGTNTGDQTSIVGITGTMAQFDTAVSDGNIVYQSQALGTPSSGTLTNCTGLPLAGVVDSTTEALGVGSLEVGHASDTTLSRSAAGVLAVEGVVIPTISSTNTLTNKRKQPRVYSAANNASLTPEIDTYDIFHLTAMSAATAINNHSTSTPADGELMEFRFLDNGTARALTWGTAYVAKAGVTLPTTTVLSKNLVCLFEYNSNLAKWNLLATGQEA